MKLTVEHMSVYRFTRPRAALRQSQRLEPSVFEGQTVLDWQAETDGAVTGAQFRDGAGDSTVMVRVPGPVEEVAVRVRGVIETQDLAGVLRGHREKVPPMAYLRETRATRPDMAIAELAQAATSKIASALDQAHALCHAVHGAIAYTPGSTDTRTTAAEALAEGKGVCQDHTHVMIAAALHRGIPARYVAGYLFARPDGDETEALAGEASHAWAELHIDGLGWVGFDPANACCPDARYIRLCSGFDAFDAAPIRGIAAGEASGEDEALDVTVAVEAVQQ